MEIHYTELSLDFEAIAYSHDSIAKMSLSDKDDDVQWFNVHLKTD